MSALLRTDHKLCPMLLSHYLYNLPSPVLWSYVIFSMPVVQSIDAFLLYLPRLHSLHWMHKQLIRCKLVKSMLALLFVDSSMHSLLFKNWMPVVLFRLYSKCYFSMPGLHLNNEQLHNMFSPIGLHSMRCRLRAGRTIYMLPFWHDLLHWMPSQ